MNDDELRERLDIYYGRSIPQSVHSFARWYGGDAKRRELFWKRFYVQIHFPEELFDAAATVPSPLTPAYFTDPIELMPILGGYARYGLLSLAPEIEDPETLPFVVSDPNCYEQPVQLIAENFPTALSRMYQTDCSEPDSSFAFGFPIARNHDENTFTRYAPPSIPNAYAYERGIEATGVLAPVAAFDGGGPPEFPDTEAEFEGAVTRNLRRAQAALRNGYPATTILIAREIRALSPGLWHEAADDDLEHAMTLWIEAARTLGRPSHANMVERVRNDYRSGRRPKPPENLPEVPAILESVERYFERGE